MKFGVDADTTGAVYGQIAGAYYGLAGIPENWNKAITHGEGIREIADRIFELAFTG